MVSFAKWCKPPPNSKSSAAFTPLSIHHSLLLLDRITTYFTSRMARNRAKVIKYIECITLLLKYIAQ